MPRHSWVFPAQLVRVIDGDTIVARLDCGFNTYRIDHLRLLGVNAPELRGATRAAGEAAAAYVLDWMLEAEIALDWPFIIETHKSDSFGRYLALCYRVVDQACLNDDLLESGHAVVYE